jgi:hypothetical protein
VFALLDVTPKISRVSRISCGRAAGHGQAMTHRPTPASDPAATAHSRSDAVRQLVRLLARQAAREAFGVTNPEPEDDPHGDQAAVQNQL